MSNTQDELYQEIKKIMHGEANDISMSDSMLAKPQIIADLFEAYKDNAVMKAVRQERLANAEFYRSRIEPFNTQLENDIKSMKRELKESTQCLTR